MNQHVNATRPPRPAPERPAVPARAVITAGMPYGNKDLHFGHIGGMFVQADAFARFLRDRIGAQNVVFVSGTDCYGSPIVESHRQQVEAGSFQGSLEDFVRWNHDRQREVLDAYDVSLDLFSASGFGRSAEIHAETSAWFFETLASHGHLVKLSSSQFFDPEAKALLNGRQVVGQCPIPGCKSEKAYADECALGHPYEPKDLVDPRSTLTGAVPELRAVENWYLDLPKFHGELSRYADALSTQPFARPYVVSGLREFLEPPVIYVKADNEALLADVVATLPPHERREQPKNHPIKLVFQSLAERTDASGLLTRQGVRFREGKTLVPFRLSGDVEWGVPVPKSAGQRATFWVWPESLWAPYSFTRTLLESRGLPHDEWKRWWCSKEARAYQFIGEDNLYFYGLAEMGLFMGLQGSVFSAEPSEGQPRLPDLVVNNHILYFDKKASSSSELKPPMARDLLNHYTSDQLRAHFLALGLGLKSVGFKPKPLDPNAGEKDADPVLKEGNLLCNSFNKAVRTCFHTAQKYFGNRVPHGEPSAQVVTDSTKAILDFERAMMKHAFHEAMAVLDNYVRSLNKAWSAKVKPGADIVADDPVLRQALVDGFHMIRVATVLLHPVAPAGTERIREYLKVGVEFWSWERIFDPIGSFFPNPAEHELKTLEARVDFFPKHPSQFGEA